ncbi:sulfur carrier protein ThiS [SAR202 cluster bacterium AD-802-E10_MRT_200m]|nr:sulfur carrier protein ThiS [SAR202 cluster bacterium AD-802-E10_MRT_200m]
MSIIEIERCKQLILNVTINGELRQFSKEILLPELLKNLGVNERFIAIAYNGSVLRREEIGSVTLKDGDILELVRPVGGG